jgi:peroxiredoxin
LLAEIAGDHRRVQIDFTLPDQAGRPTTLSDELRGGAVVLVFFRGDW